MADDSITKRNARTSPLLLLPAELRNQIYGYVLASDTLKMVTPKVTKQSGYCVVEKSTNETIGLVRVCHQIKAETAYMPCVADTVHFATIDDFDQNAAALSASQRAAVTKLSVNVELVFATLNTNFMIL